jgi:hypothetical protein
MRYNINAKRKSLFSFESGKKGKLQSGVRHRQKRYCIKVAVRVGGGQAG